jgi:LacI family transcriptional regulator
MVTRLKDIAKDLGLSVPAVCKAIKGDKDISEATRRKVLRRVRELNYQPNLLARGLITGQSHAIGLVVPQLTPSFFAEIAQGVASTVQERGYTLLLAASNEDPALEARELQNLVGRNVDGLLVASAQPAAGASLFRMLQRRKVPFVLLDREVKSVSANFVGMDNVALGKLATAHLLACGCRRPAHVACLESANGPGRRDGYLATLSDAGLSTGAAQVANASANNAEAGYAAMCRLLSTGKPPDGVFCFSDSPAVGAMRAVLDTGLRVPEDVRLVGAGNAQFTDFLRVPLSTVDVSTYDTGCRAALLLLAQRDNRGKARPQTIRMPLRLIERESTVPRRLSRKSGNRPVLTISQ